ncbi:MAG: DNA alkylation repair protein [Bacteroidetes bacterium]|nr:DNA alkylation repair protein [Bacteroidota bacterium]
MNTHPLVSELRAELSLHADPVRAESANRYFKEGIKCYGIPAAKTREIGKRFNAVVKGIEKDELIKLCLEIFEADVFDESIIAISWLMLKKKELKPEDWVWLDAVVDKRISNWAVCDTFCNHLVGSFLDKYPEYASRLLGWTSSSNRWKKRAAAVSLIVPAKKGKFGKEVFAIAERLLGDSDDMVQKGYGWLLKVFAQSEQEEVEAFLRKHVKKISRTAFRYAIEKFPSALKSELMAL